MTGKVVLLGTKGVNLAEKELRLVNYHVDGKDFCIATNRHDLTAEEIAEVYKLRRSIKTFFGWWRRHLGVYYLIASVAYVPWGNYSDKYPIVKPDPKCLP